MIDFSLGMNEPNPLHSLHYDVESIEASLVQLRQNLFECSVATRTSEEVV